MSGLPNINRAFALPSVLMDRASVPSLTPGVRGVFDEETCRMRLHEIGSDIVPSYPFAYGIQEIYAILLHEYGLSQIADVMSLLHDLLQDESYEGFIWRSWRHGWRHRNDDILNPFVPAVEGFVLPPPTSRRIRALRGANFSAAEQSRLSALRTQLVHDDDRPSYISNSSMHHSVDLGHSLSVDLTIDIDYFQEPSRLGDQTCVVAEQGVDEGQSIGPQNYSANHKTARTSASGIQLNVLRKFIPASDDEKAGDAEHKSTEQAQETVHVCSDSQSSRDSQQDFADATNDVDQMDDPTLLIFELMMREPRPVPRHGFAQGHLSNKMILRPVVSEESTRDLGIDLEDSSRGFQLHLDQIDHGNQQSQGRFGTESRLGDSDAHPRLLGTFALVPTLNAELVAEQPADDFAWSLAPSSWYQDPAGDGTDRFLPDKTDGDEISAISFSAVGSHTVAKSASSINSDTSEIKAFQARLPDGSDLPRFDSREISVSNNERYSLFPDPALPTSEPFAAGAICKDTSFRGESYSRKPHDQDENALSRTFSPGRYSKDTHHDRCPKNRPTPVFPFREETRPKLIIQRGWSFLRHMPKIFQHNRQGKKASRRDHRGEDEIPSISRDHFRSITRKAGWCAMTQGHSSTDLGPKPTMIARTFDGAGDVNDTQSTMDLNKALPPQPHPSTECQGLSTLTATPPLRHSQEANPQTSPASIASSNLRVSSKEHFQRTAHHLVHPESIESNSPTPIRSADSDNLSVASKYDPLARPKIPDPFKDVNPFTVLHEVNVPRQSSLESYPKSPDPMKRSIGHNIPQSQSEGRIYSPKYMRVLQGDPGCYLAQSDGTNDDANPQSRGRGRSRNLTPTAEESQRESNNAVIPEVEQYLRSRSPVKRLLGLGKSQSSRDIIQEKEVKDDHEKKAGLRGWGDIFRHGFMTNTESKLNVSAAPAANKAFPPETSRSQTPANLTIPISLPPLRQAKLYCEVELMICVTANKFLKAQQKAGLMSADSISKVLNQWLSQNRPQVLEFQFDQATQRDLINYNINTFKFHGEARANPIFLNATMYAWKIMAREMSVRTYCAVDSVVRKHLHDTHRVLDMLGAGMETFVTLQQIQVSALKEIAEEQKRKLDRQKRRESETGNWTGTRSAKAGRFGSSTSALLMSAPMSTIVDEQPSI